METALEVFNYEGTRVRTVVKDGEVWFVAKDVCDILELDNPTEAIRPLDEDEKNTLRISEGIRGNPNVNIINEPGLYALVFRSNKPEAKAFARWVRHEVLPQVMHTGSYNAKPVASEVSEYQLQQLNLERAKFLQHMIDVPAFPLTDESKAVIAHEAFKLVTGHEYLGMLPTSTEQWYTASDIGELLGISANKVGRIAKEYGLKPPVGEVNKYGRWIYSKSKYSPREVPSFVYTKLGLDWFMAYRDGVCKEA